MSNFFLFYGFEVGRAGGLFAQRHARHAHILIHSLLHYAVFEILSYNLRNFVSSHNMEKHLFLCAYHAE